MSREHKISTKQILKFLTKHEWSIWGVKGSHYILRKCNTDLQLQVPLRKELGKTTLVSTMERAGFTVEDLYKELGYR
jgi:predicted RNA binding protein YcfA (HicA-like mRNA interferase family)